MFKKTRNLCVIGLVAVLSLLTACKDFIEKDITENTPVLILPSINDTVPSNPVYFKWEELDGATKYRLEVVSPSFSNIQEYNVDSIVFGTNFQIDLDSNVYEVRLTALNAGYESKPTAPRKFWLGSSQGSSSSGVLLDLLADGAYVNESFDGIFKWYILNGTNSYAFELHRTASFAGQKIDDVDQLGTTNVTSFTGAQLGEGVFSWGVKAFLSNNNETNFSKRVFYVDTINPTIAALSTPVTNTYSPAGSIPFTWSLPSDNGAVQSPVMSIFEIATDNAFTNVFPPDTLVGTTISKNLLQGTYYWRVKLRDKAGNNGLQPNVYRVLNVTP